MHSPICFLVHLLVLRIILPSWSRSRLPCSLLVLISSCTALFHHQASFSSGVGGGGSVQLISSRLPLHLSSSSYYLIFFHHLLNTFVGFQFFPNFLLHWVPRSSSHLQPYGLWRCHRVPMSPFSSNSAILIHHLPFLWSSLLPFLTWCQFLSHVSYTSANLSLPPFLRTIGRLVFLSKMATSSPKAIAKSATLPLLPHFPLPFPNLLALSQLLICCFPHGHSVHLLQSLFLPLLMPWSRLLSLLVKFLFHQHKQSEKHMHKISSFVCLWPSLIFITLSLPFVPLRICY